MVAALARENVDLPSGRVEGEDREFTVRTLGELASPKHRFSFNGPFDGKRSFAFSELSFAEAQGVRSLCGSTVNDAVLAALAGGIADYLARRGDVVAGLELSVICPVNVRCAEEDGAFAASAHRLGTR